MSFDGARVDFHENGITLSWPEAVILPPQATVAAKPGKPKGREDEDEDSDESVPAWRESGEADHVKVQVPEAIQGILSSVEETMRLSVEEQRADRLKQRFKTVWRSAVCVSESDISSALAKAREAHLKIRQLRESDAKEEESACEVAIERAAAGGGGILDKLGDALPGLIPKVIGMIMGGEAPQGHEGLVARAVPGIPMSGMPLAGMSGMPIAGMGLPIGMQGMPSGIGPDDFSSYLAPDAVPNAPPARSVDEVLRLSQSFGDHDIGQTPKPAREVARAQGPVCAACRRVPALPGGPRCQACADAHEEQLRRMKPQMICCGCKAAPAFENSALCQACIMKLASQHTARQARPQARIQQQPTPQTMAPQARPQTMASQPSTPLGPPAADETTG